MSGPMEAQAIGITEGRPRNRGERPLSTARKGEANDTQPASAAQGLEAIVAGNFLTLPAWFPAAQAVKVLRHKGKSFALVEDRGGARQVADVLSLEAAPAHKTLAWCATPLGPAIAPTTSLDEVSNLIEDSGAHRLPLLLGSVLVGIVTRTDAEQARFPCFSADCLAAA